MSSPWTAEVFAVFRKELITELRTKSASYTAFMLSLVTVFTLAFAFFGRQLTVEAASGMLWAALLFAGVGTLVRALVAEEEQGTGDLLRMWSRPHAVYWGKFLFGFVQMTLTSIAITAVFLLLTSVGVTRPLLMAGALLGSSAALAGMITLVSALISRGSNRGTLAGVIALPLLVPLVAMGVDAGRVALDANVVNVTAGWASCGGVWLYTLLVLATAPFQFAAVWGEP